MKLKTLTIMLLVLISCSSDEDIATTPELATTSITDITQTGATSGGNISSNGGADIIERGVVWSTSQNPTVALTTKTSDGTGIGSFTSNIADLTPGTSYFIRAYATNSVGTAYGDEVNFTTTAAGVGKDTTTEVVDVTNPITGRVWMDRNLGASRAATSSTDTEAFGDLYQWGRGADGHEKINSLTTSTLSSTNQPSHGDFILVATNSPYDWRSPQNTNLWQGVNGVNNPCPNGYRLPTVTELEEERLSWSSNNAAGAFASPLKLPVAGARRGSVGTLFFVGTNGYYWSSTVSGIESRDLRIFNGGAIVDDDWRAGGRPVRCIKD